FTMFSKGIRVDQWDLSPIGLKSIPFFEPPLSEQKAIAEYLDKKTAQINELVSAKQKQIELLKEYKQSVIAKAVTGKLDERREKRKWKDSGISWIGKIPENWEVDKLGHRFIQRKEKVSDKDYPPLSVSKMGVTPQLESACKTDDGDNRKLVLKGDFVVNSRSDRKGSCGVSHYLGSVSLINIVLKPRNELCNLYFHYLFRSNNYIEEFYRMGRGIVADLWTTRWSEMRTIMIPVPPLSEQKEIVAYIEKKVSSIDSQIASIENQIANLNEYKQSLISGVVTGKVKVC
ncbi:MAG: restriction endonuclease subunit S, partial [Bacteroidales bacterium]|nr:restriction endonuclease subunit S [Bacteroidales bacterium]